MSIFRTVKEENYSIIHNDAITDSDMTWEARGMLAYLLSKPDGWEVRNDDLVKQSPSGQHKTKRIIKELEQAGYMHRRKERADDGTFMWVTEVYERPESNPHHKNGTTPQFSTDGKPPYIVNTDRASTENTSYASSENGSLAHDGEQESEGEQENGKQLSLIANRAGNQEPQGQTTTIRNDHSPTREGKPKRKGRAKKEWEQVADDMADWFTTKTGLSTPNSFGGYVKLWRKPLWKVVELCNGDKTQARQEIANTISDFWDRDNPLTIKSPLSLLSTIESNIAQRRRSNKTPAVVTEQGGVWV